MCILYTLIEIPEKTGQNPSNQANTKVFIRKLTIFYGWFKHFTPAIS